MSTEQVDSYMSNLYEPKKSTLLELRRTILRIVPDAEQGLSYGVPVFRLHGKNIAGFSAAKSHLSYLPHSGSVIAAVAEELADYETSKGALKFSTTECLPEHVVESLITARLEEV